MATDIEPKSEPAVASRVRRLSRRLRWLLGVAGALLLFTGGMLVGLRPLLTRDALAAPRRNAHAEFGMPVNTITPVEKTLVRTLEHPGSIRPVAQAQLYAKTSGHIRFIQRDCSARAVAATVGQHLLSAPPSPTSAVSATFALQRLLEGAPLKDIGARVRAGEVVIQLDVPELVQDVAQKEALLTQSEAELHQAKTALNTFDATIAAADAQKKQADADIARYASEQKFQELQLKRLEDLLKDKVGTLEGVEEQRNKVNAAKAAWDSSRAKADAAKAEQLVVSSKFAAARDDILVKEAKVRVAREDVRRAQVQADYVNIRATIDGVITYRAVDEGDFVQNSSTGQGRHVLTIAALDRVKVVLQVPEREAPLIRIGAEAIVHVDARAGWSTTGRVARTSGALDGESRTMPVEIDLDNHDRQLLPGMYGQVVLTLQRVEKARAIPASAVYSRRGENYILVVADGVAHRQRVRIRYDDGKELEVVKLDGDREVPLDGSEELIVSNKGEIAEGQRVHATRLGRGGPAPRTVAAAP